MERARSGHPAIMAEAAAWLARMQADDRSAADETAFRAWLAADARHRDAFGSVTAVWERAGGVARGSLGAARTRRAALVGGSLGLAGALGTLAALSLGRETVYTTTRGERRRIALDDGSAVLLDSRTRLAVQLSRSRRRLRLEHGRAHFQVAPDPLRPFVVEAGERRVVAVGTAFDVACDPGAVSVVLVEGRIAVGPNREGAPLRMMVAGQRLRAPRRGAERLDAPSIEHLTAWQVGRAVFDGDTLADAVAEFNRYSGRPIVLADRALGARPISGVYDTDDAEAFARSAGLLLGAPVHAGPDQIVLGAAAGPADPGKF